MVEASEKSVGQRKVKSVHQCGKVNLLLNWNFSSFKDADIKCLVKTWKFCIIQRLPHLNWKTFDSTDLFTFRSYT